MSVSPGELDLFEIGVEQGVAEPCVDCGNAYLSNEDAFSLIATIREQWAELASWRELNSSVNGGVKNHLEALYKWQRDALDREEKATLEIERIHEHITERDLCVGCFEEICCCEEAMR